MKEQIYSFLIILFLLRNAFPCFISLLCHSLLCLNICLLHGLGLLENFSNWIHLLAVYLRLCLIERIIDSAAFGNATQWQPCICRSCRFACSPCGSCAGQSAAESSAALLPRMSCPHSLATMAHFCTGKVSALDTAKTISVLKSEGLVTLRP